MHDGFMVGEGGGYQPKKAVSDPNLKPLHPNSDVWMASKPPDPEILNARRYSLACKNADVKRLENEIKEIEDRIKNSKDNESNVLLKFKIESAIEASIRDAVQVFETRHDQRGNDILEYVGSLMRVRMDGIFNEKS